MSNAEDEQVPPSGGPEAATATEVEPGNEAQAEQEAKRKLDLAVEIADIGPCKKHIKVTIPPSEIERQFDDSLKSVRREAVVPGFRPGHAPATLVRKRFRKELEGQVKSSLLMSALEQIDEENKVNPITRPELDLEAIELKHDTPLVFEMDVEVQPEFSLPNYKGLKVQRPVRSITEADVDTQYTRFLERYAQEVPKTDEPAALGDLITANFQFEKDGVLVNQAKEIKFRLFSELRLQDGLIPDLGTALAGARPNDVREARVEIGSSSTDAALRGQTLRAVIQVLDVKTLRLPEVDNAFLSGIGFDSMAELREALRGVLERRRDYEQQRAVRQSVLKQLVDQTPFDLPADLVSRQEKSTLRSLVSEMRQAGFSDAELRAREAEVRANAHEITLRELKEFFILSRIADSEEIKVEEDDVALEIERIAIRTDESPRRVRARIEKEGLGDQIASQILDRKTLDRILESADIEDVATEAAPEQPVETLDESVSQVPAEEESRADGDESSPTAS